MAVAGLVRPFDAQAADVRGFPEPGRGRRLLTLRARDAAEKDVGLDGKMVV
jgi:hypothetical protein